MEERDVFQAPHHVFLQNSRVRTGSCTGRLSRIDVPTTSMTAKDFTFCKSSNSSNIMLRHRAGRGGSEKQTPPSPNQIGDSWTVRGCITKQRGRPQREVTLYPWLMLGLYAYIVKFTRFVAIDAECKMRADFRNRDEKFQFDESFWGVQHSDIGGHQGDFWNTALTFNTWAKFHPLRRPQ